MAGSKTETLFSLIIFMFLFYLSLLEPTGTGHKLSLAST